MSCVDFREFLLQFSEEGRKRSKMAYRSFVHHEHQSFLWRIHCTTLSHILPIHNVTINSNSLFVNFRWTFTFGVEKSYDGMHLAFGGTLDRPCHFKHISLKQSWFYHCQTSTAHRKRIKVDGSVAIISMKNFPIGLHVSYLSLPDTPHNYCCTATVMTESTFHITQYMSVADNTGTLTLPRVEIT